MSSFIGIFFGFLFGNMFGFEDISTQLFNQDTKLLNILEKTRRMCKKIPPSLTGFDVVGLSYHGSRCNHFANSGCHKVTNCRDAPLYINYYIIFAVKFYTL